VLHTCNLSIQEAEAKGSWVEVQPGLHSKLKFGPYSKTLSHFFPERHWLSKGKWRGLKSSFFLPGSALPFLPSWIWSSPYHSNVLDWSLCHLSKSKSCLNTCKIAGMDWADDMLPIPPGNVLPPLTSLLKWLTRTQDNFSSVILIFVLYPK
jgi:hypothetical protein